MKILIIRFSSIGDIVLTTPVVRCLKTQLDDAEIHYATKKNFKTIFEENPYIDKVHFLGESLQQYIQQLREEKFDYIIDLHNNLRTRIIKSSLGVKSFSFNKLNWKKWLIVNLKINKLPDVHIVDRYLETVSSLGVKNDSLGLDYFIPEKDHVPVEWLPETHRNGYIAYVIGAQHATKKLPLHKMIELCAKINRPIVLLGGKEDQDMGEGGRFIQLGIPELNPVDGRGEAQEKLASIGLVAKCPLDQGLVLARPGACNPARQSPA